MIVSPRQVVKRGGIFICILAAINLYLWEYMPWESKKIPDVKPTHSHKGSDEYENPKSDGRINFVHVPKSEDEELELWAKYGDFWAQNRVDENVETQANVLERLRTNCQEYPMPVKGNGRRDFMWIMSNAPLNCTLIKFNVILNEMRGKALKDGRRLGNKHRDPLIEVEVYGNAEFQRENGSYLEIIESTPHISLLMLKYDGAVQEYAFPDIEDSKGKMIDITARKGFEFTTDEECTFAIPIICRPLHDLIDDSVTPSGTYIHVISDAYVDALGRVYVKSLGIEPNQCKSPALQKPMEFTREQEVFSIASNSGKVGTSIARLTPFVDFLRIHTHILIQISEPDPDYRDYLRMLGLDPGRLRHGAIQAEMVYLPQGEGCYHGHSLMLGLLSQLHDGFLKRATLPPETQDLDHPKMMLFLGDETHPLYTSISKMAFAKALKNDYAFEEFHASSKRPFIHSLVTFHSAKVIVVLGNPKEMVHLQLCAPKTEVLHVGALQPHVAELSWKLGLSYKGLLVAEGETDVTKLMPRFEEILKWMLVS